MDMEGPSARRGIGWEATSQAIAREAIAAGDSLSAVLGVAPFAEGPSDWGTRHHPRLVQAAREFVLALATYVSVGMRGSRDAFDIYSRDCAWMLMDLWISPPQEGAELAVALAVKAALDAAWPPLRGEIACGGIPSRKKASLIDSNLSQIAPGVWKFFDTIIPNVPKGITEEILLAALCIPTGKPVPVPGQPNRVHVSRANKVLDRIQSITNIMFPWRLHFTKAAVFKIPHSPEAILDHLTQKKS
jgi:hypothetical protein